MTEAERREPLTLTRLATELGEVEQLLIELAGRLSSLKEYVEIARSPKPTVLAHESEPNNESLNTPLTIQAIQGESLSGNESKNSFNFGPLPSIQWKEQIERRNATAQIAGTDVPGLAEWRESARMAQEYARIAAQKAAPKAAPKATPKAQRAATVDPIDWRNI